MARVSDAHSEIGPELRQLAQTILDRVEPAVRAAAADRRTGRFSRRLPTGVVPGLRSGRDGFGEQHPLLDAVAEHSVALLAVVRGLLDNRPETPPDSQDDPRAVLSKRNPITSVVPTGIALRRRQATIRVFRSKSRNSHSWSTGGSVVVVLH